MEKQFFFLTNAVRDLYSIIDDNTADLMPQEAVKKLEYKRTLVKINVDTDFDKKEEFQSKDFTDIELEEEMKKVEDEVGEIKC